MGEEGQDKVSPHPLGWLCTSIREILPAPRHLGADYSVSLRPFASACSPAVPCPLTICCSLAFSCRGMGLWKKANFQNSMPLSFNQTHKYTVIVEKRRIEARLSGPGPMNQDVTVRFSGLGTCLGLRAQSPGWGVEEAADQ